MVKLVLVSLICCGHLIETVRSFCPVRSHIQSKCYRSSTRSLRLSSGRDDSWEANRDLKGDFQRLEEAVDKLAESSRKMRQEQSEKLDWIAQDRRPLMIDMGVSIFLPIIYALGCLKVYNARRLGRIFESFHFIMELFYRIFVVVVPAITLISMNISWIKVFGIKKRRERLKKCNEGFNFQSNILPILIENGASSSISAFLYSAYSLTRKKMYVYTSALPVLESFAMLLHRIAFSAAMYQYPSLLYDVDIAARNGDFSGKILKKFVRLVNFMLPFGIASDLAAITLRVNWYMLMRAHNLQFLSSTSKVMTSIYVTLFLSVLLPTAHLFAFLKIIRIRKIDNSSLNEDEASFDINANSSRCLRWFKMWRCPRKLVDVIRSYYLLWTADLQRSRQPAPEHIPSSYSCFEPGLDFDQTIGQYGMIKLDGETPVEESKLKIIELVLDDNEKNSISCSEQSRLSWISRAYAEKSLNLQKDFNEKTYYDPLGIAVMKTLNAAMSFEYDHDTPLSSDTEVDIHRLRARAAKSAVRRAREIYNPEVASKFLDSIKDPMQRAQAAIKLKGEANDEIESLADDLMRLLPIGAPAPKGMTPLQFEPNFQSSDTSLDLHSKKVKVGKNLPNSLDPSTWTTIKPQQRTYEIKDESEDVVIGDQYGKDALTDRIFRERHSGRFSLDKSKASNSMKVMETLRNAAKTKRQVEDHGKCRILLYISIILW